MIILFGILVGFSFLVSVPMGTTKKLIWDVVGLLFHTLSSISVGIAAAMVYGRI